MIKNKLGFTFATPIVIMGVFINICALPLIIQNPLLGLGLIIIGLFFWTCSYGFQIDKVNDQFREYGSFFGFKTGKWNSLKKVPFITVLPGQSGLTVYSRSNRATSIMDHRYEVCLLTETHRTKFVVQKFESKTKAMDYADLLAANLKLEIVQYSPVISEKTKSRRIRK